jgi:predicted transcriptional regulator
MSDLGKRAADIGLSAKQIATESGLAALTVGRLLRGQGDFLQSTHDRVLAVVQKHEKQRLNALSARVSGHKQERVRA